MADLQDRDRAVLRVLSEGRANPMLIREETDLDKGQVNTVLVKLTRDGLARRKVQGLYEITDDGRRELADD
jgi:DNA-binding PadR family transcriptional regulator